MKVKPEIDRKSLWFHKSRTLTKCRFSRHEKKRGAEKSLNKQLYYCNTDRYTRQRIPCHPSLSHHTIHTQNGIYFPPLKKPKPREQSLDRENITSSKHSTIMRTRTRDASNGSGNLRISLGLLLPWLWGALWCLHHRLLFLS